MKRVLSFVIAALMMLSLCACGQSEVSEAAVPLAMEPTATPTAAPYTITLYTGDGKSEAIVPVECQLSELTPQAIADKLFELGVFSSKVTVNSCDKGSINILRLDMGEDFADQIRSTGISAEHVMMGSLVNSFLSVYGGDGLTLTVDGETLTTGHGTYDRAMIAYAE